MLRRDAALYHEAIGRDLRIIAYGHFGLPVLAFPTMNCRANDWEDHGMFDVLSPWIDRGLIKLYCIESIDSEAWMNFEAHPAWRAKRALAHEAFVLETVVPAIRRDCNSDSISIKTTGCSVGGLHAANFALKYPWIFNSALCMSGRYDLGTWFEGFYNEDVYDNDPIAYVAKMSGDHLDTVRRNVHLTLVVGQGAHEGGCVPQTHKLADLLEQKGIPHWRDIWGHDAAHHWDWWKKQMVYHLSHEFGRV